MTESVRWSVVAADAPELADFAVTRLAAGPAYLATTRKDGSPRVHPTSPEVRDGRLTLLMYPHSPKVADLRRDPRYALHTTVDDDHGNGGEVSIRGTGLVLDPADEIDGWGEQDGYVRVELLVSGLFVGIYDVPGSVGPTLTRWPAPT